MVIALFIIINILLYSRIGVTFLRTQKQYRIISLNLTIIIVTISGVYNNALNSTLNSTFQPEWETFQTSSNAEANYFLKRSVKEEHGSTYTISILIHLLMIYRNLFHTLLPIPVALYLANIVGMPTTTRKS